MAILGRFKIPVFDSAMWWPNRGIFGSFAMCLGDLNFGGFGSFDIGTQHPHVPNLNSFFLQVTADLIVGGGLFESID